MKPTQIIIGIVAVLALAGGGFAAGMTYAGAQTPTTTGATATTGTTGARGGSGGRAAFGQGGAAAQQAVVGRVLAVNEGSITIAAVDRSQGQPSPGASPATTSQIVLVGTNTRIVKTTETDVKLGDIKLNDQVTVVGTTDATGMVGATAIVVGSTNVLGQLFGSQTGTPGGFGGRPGASAAPTKAP